MDDHVSEAPHTGSPRASDPHEGPDPRGTLHTPVHTRVAHLPRPRESLCSPTRDPKPGVMYDCYCYPKQPQVRTRWSQPHGAEFRFRRSRGVSRLKRTFDVCPIGTF
jgi:hypothetical protein